MDKINKKRIYVIFIYTLHLAFYIAASYLVISNMSRWFRVAQKLKIDSVINQYNHLYLSIYYLTLSTYYMIKGLNIYIQQRVTVLLHIIAYSFVILAIYKYYTIDEFINILLITIGLTLSLKELYKRINLSKILKKC